MDIVILLEGRATMLGETRSSRPRSCRNCARRTDSTDRITSREKFASANRFSQPLLKCRMTMVQ